MAAFDADSTKASNMTRDCSPTRPVAPAASHPSLSRLPPELLYNIMSELLPLLPIDMEYYISGRFEFDEHRRYETYCLDLFTLAGVCYTFALHLQYRLRACATRVEHVYDLLAGELVRYREMRSRARYEFDAATRAVVHRLIGRLPHAVEKIKRDMCLLKKELIEQRFKCLDLAVMRLGWYKRWVGKVINLLDGVTERRHAKELSGS